jgi:uncharacterized membrane protein YfcA
MYVIAILFSLLIGVSLGLLGGGGSILTTPILIYALDVEPKAAIATSLLVVGITSAAALIPHARAGNVEWRTGLIFGAAGMVGAGAGGWLAGFIPSSILLLFFAGMMLATAFAMFRGKKEAPAEAARQPIKVPKVIAEGLVVGVVTGLVGAGGGFLVVPALTLLGGVPMRKAIGTSLLVIALKSGAGFAGHASHVSIDWQLAGVVAIAAVLGSVVGARLTAMIQPETLRRGFAGFVVVMAGFVLYQQI